MPSPALPRSLPETTSITVIHHQCQSTISHSVTSPGDSWPKKVGSFLARQTVSSSTKNSSLTEKNLKELDKRFMSDSPYYKGLTDSSLVISRGRISEASSGRAGNEAISVTSSSRSSIIIRMQEWGRSCFTVKNKDEESNSARSSETNTRVMSTSSSSSSTRTPATTTSSSSSSTSGRRRLAIPNARTAQRAKETMTKKKDGNTSIQESKTTIALLLSSTEKPLRESVSQPSFQPQTMPPRSLPSATQPPTATLLLSQPLRMFPELPPTPPQFFPQPSTEPPSLSPQAKSQPLPQAASLLLPPVSPQASLLPPPDNSPSLPPQPPQASSSLPPQTPPSLPPSPQASSSMQSQEHAQAQTKLSSSVPQQSPHNPTSPPLPNGSPTKISLPTAQTPTPKIVSVNEKERNQAENEPVFTWADKYRPDALKDFVCNRHKALELQSLAKSENCENFIFEGPPGVGKRTMIWALLREIFNAEKLEETEHYKKFHLQGEAVNSIQVNVKESPHHTEVTLSELKGYEKHIILELIKDKGNRLSNKAVKFNRDNCPALVLYEADKLSADTLQYIRWLLEKYKGCKKVFFCCTDISKLQPIKSICTIIQLLPPSTEEIVEDLEFIGRQEGITLPHLLAVKIAGNSKNNLRQAIRSFEATWLSNSSLQEDQAILTGWEEDIANIAKNIVEEQSPKQLYNIRGKLQKLIEHNVSPEFIFKKLEEELKKQVDEQLHIPITNLYEEYSKDDESEKNFPFACNRQDKERGRKHDDPVRKNVQQFMKIEEFIAKFMSWYKGLPVNKRADDITMHSQGISK